ncbi:MAG: Translation initiation factor 2 [Candidatus Ozemobacter sibiricus]|uniref:Translation initiation factor IF-2 n=1 Tax=Candidatus Ozemobacter sibiricus TaxID=2268124 RepID=A0A367ZU73_9BACT|nr:MAG: Translation initiation factor 2 [Candidatus Ozemobacter sibiricus]
MRLHEASKKYNLTNKEMSALLETLGFPGKNNPLSAIGDDVVAALEKHFASKAGGARPAPEKKPAAAATPAPATPTATPGKPATPATPPTPPSARSGGPSSSRTPDVRMGPAPKPATPTTAAPPPATGQRPAPTPATTPASTPSQPAPGATARPATPTSTAATGTSGVSPTPATRPAPTPPPTPPRFEFRPSPVIVPKVEEKKKGGPKPPRIDHGDEVEVNQQITFIKTAPLKKEPPVKKLKKKIKPIKPVHGKPKPVLDEVIPDVIEVPADQLAVEQTVVPEQERVPRIVVPQEVTVNELAKYLEVQGVDIIKKLMGLGVFASLNQRLEPTQVQLVGREFGKEIVFSQDVIDLEETPDAPADLKPRPPVVTIMGHVDHGKTSLLDKIRKSRVAEGEIGGITQHIGAYQVTTKNGIITFLDTPGHEAFTAMRAQGAQVTDIAVLVVAADDGVQPQTIEALHHAQAAGVPIIVAINKIDKPEANPDKVKQMLMPYNLVAEDWGGKTIMVPVSAKRGDGIEDLLEMILLQAEMMELKANPNRPGKGTIIEAKLDRGMGPLATVLVQNGTIRVGDNIVCGTSFGRVKALINDAGTRVKEAGPAMPVAILGLSDVPRVGDKLMVVEDAKFARYVSVLRQKKEREERLARENRTKLMDLFKQVTDGKRKELPIIIKADVQGSAGALKDALERLSTNEVKVNAIHTGVGAIIESDVMLAAASNAIIIGFHVRPAPGVEEIAAREDVEIKVFRIIYDAIDAVKSALKGMYEPVYEEEIIGRAEVRKVFKISGVGTIAGSFVLEGKITRDASVRIIRDGVEIYEGKVSSLKRFKDDIREVQAGYECGIGVSNYNDLKENDILELFRLKQVERELKAEG